MNRNLMRGALWAIVAAILFLISGAASAESGAEGWLRYAALPDTSASLPTRAAVIGNDNVVQNAASELLHALDKTGKQVPASGLPDSDAFVLGTWKEIHPLFHELKITRAPSGDGFWLKTIFHKKAKYWLIIGASDRGVLYGTFSLLSRIAQQQDVQTLDDSQSPSAPIRWVSQWDNLDGSIERGYAGRSIFFDQGQVRADLTRAGDYARLLASVGINGCAINNVNADPRILSAEFLPQLVRIADAFRPWGVKLAVSVDMSSPMAVGGLKTFDPLDPDVADWWKKTTDAIYERIPDFGGFVVKADSEGRSGPSQYGRTAADAANVIARALAPHHGVLMYRAFVYNHHLDWRDMKADRARAAYDYFHPLDGKFEDNVVIQIKYGPIDFQVREPASPLFGAMPHTNQAIELQVTQEYTGQQRHLVFLAPMWKEILDFDMHVNGATPVKQIVSGETWHRPLGGYNAVVNVGLDENWLAHPLAMANLYAYGRLAWNPNLSAKEIAGEWTRLTFNNKPQVVETISKMLLSSWHIYESYTGPLGAGTLTDILGNHYGPGIESSERNGWGQWHRADEHGMGMDRTIATGTGYIGQYSPDVQKQYETLAACPDELLLFMHHVPYTYVLHSGKTVIQHIYDSHYDGAEQAAGLVTQWRSLSGQIDDERYSLVLARLDYQADYAIFWRDTIVNWFWDKSGITDTKGRPHPLEKGKVDLSQIAVDVNPMAIVTENCFQKNSCAATFPSNGAAGKYNIAASVTDQNNRVSRYEVLVNGKLVDEFAAEGRLDLRQAPLYTSECHLTSGVFLRPGDAVEAVRYHTGAEPAFLYFLEISRDAAK